MTLLSERIHSREYEKIYSSTHLALGSFLTSLCLVFNEAFPAWVRSPPVSYGRFQSLGWHRPPCPVTDTPVLIDYVLCSYSSPSFRLAPDTSSRSQDPASSVKPSPAKYMALWSSVPTVVHAARTVAPSCNRLPCCKHPQAGH